MKSRFHLSVLTSIVPPAEEQSYGRKSFIMAPRHPSFTPTFHNKPYTSIDLTSSNLSCNGMVYLSPAGARGLGRAIAENFITVWTSVFLKGFSKSTVQEAAHEISGSCSDASRVPYKATDALDPSAVRSAIGAAVEHLGAIDVLINNAGYLDERKSVAESNLPDYRNSLEAIAKGGFLRVARSGVTYINISSGVAHSLVFRHIRRQRWCLRELWSIWLRNGQI